MSGSAKMAPIYTFIFLFPGITLHFMIIPTMEDLRGIPLKILGDQWIFTIVAQIHLSHLQLMKPVCKPKYFLY